MKKSIKRSVVEESKKVVAIGLDVSDRKSCWVAIDNDGKIGERGEVGSRAAELQRWAAAMPPTLIAIEAGPHSPWMQRVLASCGHEVIVANPAKLPSISRSRSKSDWRDAEQLARLARFDRTMLHEIKHRSEEAQRDLQLIRSRDALVRSRSMMISHVRASVKAHGSRLERCSAEAFVNRARQSMTPELLPLFEPALSAIDADTRAIAAYDKDIEKRLRAKYPDAEMLEQIKGVGTLTALAYMLVLGDATRFRSSRMVGPYLGLTPGRDQSGQSDPQKGISKEGDQLLRRLLVQSAHYILGPFGVDSDLRRHGEAIAARGGKNAKKRAAVAVARKLAVLLHHLWITKDVYIPLYKERSSLPTAA